MWLQDSYETIYQRAQILRQRGTYQAAIQEYRRIVDRLGGLKPAVRQRRPDLTNLFLQASSELADLLRGEHQYEEAIAVRERQAEHDPDPERSRRWQREAASLRIALGQVDSGLATLHALGDTHPDEIWNWLALGIECRRLGRLDESIKYLQRAIQIGEGKPEGGTAYLLLGEAYTDLGQTDEAIAAWEQSMALQPDLKPMLIRRACSFLIEQGDYDRASKQLAREQNRLYAGFYRGLIKHEQGDRAKAKKEWQQVAAQNPREYEEGHEAWAEAVLRLGQPATALPVLEDLLERDRGSLRCIFLLGLAWAMMGKPDPAREVFERVLRVLQRQEPQRVKLDAKDWRLVDALVEDTQVKASLQSYFAVVLTPRA